MPADAQCYCSSVCGRRQLHGWVSNHYTEHLQTDKKTKPSGTNGIFCFSSPHTLSLVPLFWSFGEGGQGWVSFSLGSPHPITPCLLATPFTLRATELDGKVRSYRPTPRQWACPDIWEGFSLLWGLALIPATETHHTQGGFVHPYLATWIPPGCKATLELADERERGALSYPVNAFSRNTL